MTLAHDFFFFHGWGRNTRRLSGASVPEFKADDGVGGVRSAGVMLPISHHTVRSIRYSVKRTNSYLQEYFGSSSYCRKLGIDCILSRLMLDVARCALSFLARLDFAYRVRSTVLGWEYETARDHGPCVWSWCVYGRNGIDSLGSQLPCTDYHDPGRENPSGGNKENKQTPTADRGLVLYLARACYYLCDYPRDNPQALLRRLEELNRDDCII